MDHWPYLMETLPEALRRVPEVYYRSPSANVQALRAVLDPNDPRFPGLATLSFRHGERAFCYELYHHLRNGLDAVQQRVPRWDQRLMLQGELHKWMLGALAQDHFGIEKLEKNFIPDFLLHVPGNFDFQEVVMEVKADPELRLSLIQADIAKLQQFITRYRYKIGVFLSINTDAERLLQLNRTEEGKRWLDENITTPQQIFLVCMHGPDSDPVIVTLSDL